MGRGEDDRWTLFAIHVRHRVSSSLSWTFATRLSHQGLLIPIDLGKVVTSIDAVSTAGSIQIQMRFKAW